MRCARYAACIICGAMFKAKNNAQQCCSSACASIYRGQMKTKATPIASLVATCKHCGKKYKPKAVNRIDYCSRNCAYAAKREIAKKCPKCGLTRSQHTTGSPCYALVPVECATCGKPFTPRRGHKQIHCCRRCARRSGSSDRMHRIRQATAHPRSSPVYRAHIFKRDNYVCQLCGQPIDFGLPAGDPMSGTIDHVIPLSKGGWHAPDNVQSAHLRCNCSKGAH